MEDLILNFSIKHTNINITNMDASIDFYQEALGLHVQRQKKSDDGSFCLTYLTDQEEKYQLELTWLRDHPEPYNLGENEWHIAFSTDNYEKAHALHKEMDCICFENPSMGIYFIQDPDGYWLEIIPNK